LSIVQAKHLYLLGEQKMSKIQISELNVNASELEVLDSQETTEVVGGGDVNNNQSNSSSTNQNGVGNFSMTLQGNNAYISNSEYNSYGYWWY
jgi:hypothetical protein